MPMPSVITVPVDQQLTITSPLNAHATVDLQLNSSLVVNTPMSFHATVDLTNIPPNVPHAEFVDLVGLATADSYSLKNDLVSIKNANGTIIDQLHVAPDIAQSLALPGSTTQLIADQGNVYLTIGFGNERIPPGGTVLHT
jgi:hypothetical protein